MNPRQATLRICAHDPNDHALQQQRPHKRLEDPLPAAPSDLFHTLLSALYPAMPASHRVMLAGELSHVIGEKHAGLLRFVDAEVWAVLVETAARGKRMPRWLRLRLGPLVRRIEDMRSSRTGKLG